MKYIGAGLVWIGYAMAAAAVAFGTHDGGYAAAVGIIAGFFAMHASAAIAKS